MKIKYNTAVDSYFRDSESNPVKGWSSLVFAYSNIQLKVENDWRMCYLARTEGSTQAFIEWYFDFTGKIVFSLYF
jgi:peptide-N4-(N-acetyl-beta-glucosaminyl)asparagine amidase